MRIRKILLVLIIVFSLSGCVNLNNLEYTDIINTFSSKPKPANTFKKGYQYYIPKGLQLSDSGTNYAILSSGNVNYYLYVDLVSYNEAKKFSYEIDKNALYSTGINYEGKQGYVEINLWENNQYYCNFLFFLYLN